MNNTLSRPTLPPTAKRWEAHCGSPVQSDDEPPSSAPVFCNFKRLTMPTPDNTATSSNKELLQMQHHFSQQQMQDNVGDHLKSRCSHAKSYSIHAQHQQQQRCVSPPLSSYSSGREVRDEVADECDDERTIFSTRLQRAYEQSQAKKMRINHNTSPNGPSTRTLSVTPPRMLTISPSARLSIDPALANPSASNLNDNGSIVGYMSHPDDTDDEPGYGQAFLNSGSGSLDSSPTKSASGSDMFDPDVVPTFTTSSSLPSQQGTATLLSRRQSVSTRTHLEENMIAEREVSMILPNFLYLGGELVDESQLDELERLGIRRVLNMAENCDDELVLQRWGSKRYLKLGLRDHVEQDLGESLQKAIRFIASSKTPIYVHCQAGKSRSVATVIGYLIQECHWPLKKAYSHVVERRRCMSPNIGFVSQLMQLERKVLGREKAGGLVQHGGAEDVIDTCSRSTMVTRQSAL
ncbi:hypothetical protein BGW42_004208 [Actinomortierella wolfii]|nr:hypothetical protein BGW42_004208 [Actinomortierella wolfii]